MAVFYRVRYTAYSCTEEILLKLSCHRSDTYCESEMNIQTEIFISGGIEAKQIRQQIQKSV